jgi:Tol biopolymer transport system component
MPTPDATTGPTPTPDATTGPTPTPSPSLAGRLIAFDRSTPLGFQLEVIAAAGGRATPLASPDLEVPRFSPDGSWIVVANGSSEQIVFPVLLQPDGSGVHELHADQTLSLGTCVWTPDGEWLVCEAWDPAAPDRDGIYMLRATDGSGLTMIAPAGIPGSVSADGTQLVYSVTEGHQQRLAVVNLDGTGGARLGTTNVDSYPGFMADGTLYDTTGGVMGFFDRAGDLLRTVAAPGGSMNEARLSPDGQRFVFIYLAPNKGGAIATMNIDGTDLQIIVPAMNGERVAPDWQP